LLGFGPLDRSAKGLKPDAEGVRDTPNGCPGGVGLPSLYAGKRCDGQPSPVCEVFLGEPAPGPLLAQSERQ